MSLRFYVKSYLGGTPRMTKDGLPRKILGNLSHPSLDPVPPMNFRNFPNFLCWLAVPPYTPQKNFPICPSPEFFNLPRYANTGVAISTIFKIPICIQFRGSTVPWIMVHDKPILNVFCISFWRLFSQISRHTLSKKVAIKRFANFLQFVKTHRSKI